MGFGGGGSSSGEITYPKYLSEQHRTLLFAYNTAMDNATSFAIPNIVTNGEFSWDDTDAGGPDAQNEDGWDLGTGWGSAVGPVGQREIPHTSGAGNTEPLAQSPPFVGLVLGTVYTVKFFLKGDNTPTGSVTIKLGDSASVAFSTTVNDETKIFTLTYAAGEPFLQFVPTFDFNGAIGKVFVGSAAGTPYDGVNAFDPAADISVFQQRYDVLELAIDTLDPDAELTSAVDTALTEAERTFSEDHIAGALQAFEQRQLPDFNRSVNRFAGGMADINAVNGSAFIMGLSILEAQRAQSIDSFNASLAIQAEENRQTFIRAAISVIISMETFRVNGILQTTGILTDQRKLSVILKNEQIKDDLSFDVKDALWDLELFQYGGNLLASVSGASSPTAGTQEMSRGAGALTGGMQGAISGAALGISAIQAGIVGGGAAGAPIAGVASLGGVSNASALAAAAPGIGALLPFIGIGAAVGALAGAFG